MKSVESRNIVCRAVRSALRARLLSGASSLALPLASMIVTLGVCVPRDAQAQTTVTPVQTTTFTLTPSQNPIIFGAGTNIDTTAAAGVDAVFGDTSTIWAVTNQGTIQGSLRGVFLGGAGSSLINSGTIAQTGNLVTSAGVRLANGGTVTNLVNATISECSRNRWCSGYGHECRHHYGSSLYRRLPDPRRHRHQPGGWDH